MLSKEQQIAEKINQPYKFFNPIYVPILQAQSLLKLTPDQLELRIIRDLKLAPNGKNFIYQPHQSEEVSNSRNSSPLNKGMNSPIKTQKSKDLLLSKATENTTDEALDDILPEEIHTSLFLQSNNTDYKVVIRPPSVEYNIPAKNFLFIKTLTRSEL